MHPVLEHTTLRGWGRAPGYTVRVKLVKRPDGSFITTETMRDYVSGDHYAWDYLPAAWPDGYKTPEPVPHSSFREVIFGGFGFPVEPETTRDALHAYDCEVHAIRGNIRWASQCHCIQCEQLGGDCEYAPRYEDYEVDNTLEDKRADAQELRDLCDFAEPATPVMDDEELPF